MEKPFIDKKIGVLMGGKSGEREVSLRSGGGVLNSLIKQGYSAVGIDVDEHVDVKIRAEKIDIAFIILHGVGGEDGLIQGLLETMEIPYTGSGVAASALAMDKELTKLVLAQHGLPSPKTVYISGGKPAAEVCAEIEREIGFPVFLKPASEGSSLGCAVCHNSEGLKSAVAELTSKFSKMLAEPFLKGADITVGVIGTGENIRALPILEMVPDNEFYDYEAKYTPGMTKLICPARLSESMTLRAQKLAVEAHKALGCDGVSRVDFVADSVADKIYILEVNTIPGMTQTSDLPEEIITEGGTYDSLVLEILQSASLKRQK